MPTPSSQRLACNLVVQHRLVQQPLHAHRSQPPASLADSRPIRTGRQGNTKLVHANALENVISCRIRGEVISQGLPNTPGRPRRRDARPAFTWRPYSIRNARMWNLPRTQKIRCIHDQLRLSRATSMRGLRIMIFYELPAVHDSPSSYAPLTCRGIGARRQQFHTHNALRL